jgi:ArsR family transcriptional regulator, arsenate/arsenite/antimonite-responsive transcriptional repressor / arsenate reductase (thioredoxin)
MESPLSDNYLAFLKLIAHDIRWQIISALAESDMRVHEITRRLDQPQNLVSYHLQKLKQALLVGENHSQADARSIYYHLNYEYIQSKLSMVEKALAPFPIISPISGRPHSWPKRVLFICTHNSARSQMAEGMLRAWSSGLVNVESAGSEPKPLHPLAIQAMLEKSIDIRQQRSKEIKLFVQEPFDYVITVCDRARENCPTFPGNPIQIHWSIPDPALREGSEEEQLKLFRSVADDLAKRIHLLLDRFSDIRFV